MGQAAAKAMDWLLDTAVALAKWLVIPVFLLLFLQWPLRDLAGRWSREANDLGQILFALYVAVAVTAATRANAHLAADQLAASYRPGVRRGLGRAVAAFAVIPVALFIAIAARPMIGGSIASLERFADTGNPGYFVIKSALWLLTALMIAAAVRELLGAHRDRGTDQ